MIGKSSRGFGQVHHPTFAKQPGHQTKGPPSGAQSFRKILNPTGWYNRILRQFCRISIEGPIKMRKDPIVEEVRKEREAYGARFNHDLAAIFRDLKAREQASGRKYVRFAAKPCKKSTRTPP